MKRFPPFLRCSRAILQIGLLFFAMLPNCFSQNAVGWSEDFESPFGLDDWFADAGTWEIGVPTSGPGKAHSGTKLAATILGGNYREDIASRLISQPILLPSADTNPRLRFWHWYQFGGHDLGTVQIRVGNSGWTNLSLTYFGSGNGIWSRPTLDLAVYAGKSVQIAFYLESHSHYDRFGNYDSSVGPGWYVDAIVVETGTLSGLIPNVPDGLEEGQRDWIVESGIWEVGKPTSGPGNAYAGTNLVATVLAGNYQEDSSSRFISPPFTVPLASEDPRLRYWHWYQFGGHDSGEVQIRVGTGAWTRVSPQYAGSGNGIWSRPTLDLAVYAGKSVQIALYLESHSHYDRFGNYDSSVGPGWYVDEIVVETGTLSGVIPNVVDGLEEGQRDWIVESGIWEVGKPTSGPGKAYAGTNLVATVLAGNYQEDSSSRFISPPFTVPLASEHPRLRYWHWYQFGGHDSGEVQIRVGTGAWTRVSPQYAGSGNGIWSRPTLDLAVYAGKSIQIALYLESHSHYDRFGNYDSSVGPGWYVDAIVVETGTLSGLIPNVADGLEEGQRDWIVESGIWEVGKPTSGPGKAYAGTNLVATVLAGNYQEDSSSRFISPPFTVPLASEDPRLRYWHWYQFGGHDSGEVQIRVGTGAWTRLSPQYAGSGNGIWSRPTLDLAVYAGKSVQIALYLESQSHYDRFGNYDSSVGPGWYVDEIVIETGELRFNNPESFEGGQGAWTVESGIWEIGKPTSGPRAAYAGTNLAATVLAGDYREDSSSRLISPSFVVAAADEQPRLRFWQWFEFGAHDFGQVQIRAGTNSWTTLSPQYLGSSSATWSQPSLDLAPYAGKTVQIAFYLESHSHYDRFGNYDSSVGPGWYLEAIRIQSNKLPRLTDQTVIEENLLTVTIPPVTGTISYSLGSDAPEGASIDPLGVFTWVPSECHGHGTYTITINATEPDNSLTPVASTFLTVNVLETNSPPRIDPIESVTIRADQQIEFMVTAFDQDCPIKQTLSFNLEQGAPVGATINATTGEFLWTPTPEQAAIPHSITVRVTDSGYSEVEAPPNGSLSLSSIFTFCAGPLGGCAPKVLIQRTSDGTLQLVIDDGPTGVDYTIQATTELKSPPEAIVWTTLKTVRPAQQPYTFQDPEAATLPFRYYRIVRMP
jgi:hypothetical protein